MIIRKANSVGFIGRDCHLFVFRPSQLHGNYSGWGFHLRRRRNGIWIHLQVKFHQKGKDRLPGNRRTRQYEVSGWRSRDATNVTKRSDNRVGLKVYARLKLCPGGTRPEER